MLRMYIIRTAGPEGRSQFLCKKLLMQISIIITVSRLLARPVICIVVSMFFHQGKSAKRYPHRVKIRALRLVCFS